MKIKTKITNHFHFIKKERESYFIEIGYFIKKRSKNKLVEDVEKRETLCTVCW